MAAVEVTISGVLYDKLNRTMQNVVLIGEASLTGLGVGGGPIIPPGGPGRPPGTGIWPNPPEGQAPLPSHPIALPGDPWWGGDLRPAHPIVLPPDCPPGMKPPEPPNPGDPTTPVPPPAGSGGWPVGSIVPPPYVIINYPGVGPVVVAPPATTATAPSK
jgi:hypothetical protein